MSSPSLLVATAAGGRRRLLASIRVSALRLARKGEAAATRIQMDFGNLRLDDHERVCDTLNFPSDWPDGLLAHGSMEVDGRLRVVDVWESASAVDRFVEQRLGSAIGEALGDRAEQPQLTDVELRTFTRASSGRMSSWRFRRA